jgi:hypothetical protein
MRGRISKVSGEEKTKKCFKRILNSAAMETNLKEKKLLLKKNLF